eukprot:scaffold427_cov74-Cylindrotheca_fusiformis.AAC.2
MGLIGCNNTEYNPTRAEEFSYAVVVLSCDMTTRMLLLRRRLHPSWRRYSCTYASCTYSVLDGNQVLATYVAFHIWRDYCDGANLHSCESTMVAGI